MALTDSTRVTARPDALPLEAKGSKLRWTWAQDRPAAVAVLALVAFAVLVGATSSSNRLIDITFRIVLWATLAIAWNFLAGFGGQLSLGHAAFYGIGAYAAVLLFINLDISPLVGGLVGAALAAALAFIVAIASLRLRGVFFAMATFVMGIAFKALATNLADVTGGSFGQPLPLYGSWTDLIFGSRRPYLFICVVLFAIAGFSAMALRYSRFGIQLVAARADVDAAKTMGINVRRIRLLALLFSAVLTSLCGTLSAFYLSFVDPENAFGFSLSIKIVYITIIGGIGTLVGPILGAVIVIPLEQFLADNFAQQLRGLGGFALGIGFLLMVMIAPDGLYGRLRSAARSLGRRLGFGRRA